MKKKITLELIVDYDVILSNISDIIAKGCEDYFIRTSSWNSETNQEDVEIFKLKQELVLIAPFDENHLTLILSKDNESKN